MNKVQQYEISTNCIQDVLKTCKLTKKELKDIMVKVISDSNDPTKQNVKLSEYSWNISYYISSVKSKKPTILQYAENLKETKFELLQIETIYISTERNEILTVCASINDDILDEYYSKTYEMFHNTINCCVFMIATKDTIDFSAMPKFDYVLEVNDE